MDMPQRYDKTKQFSWDRLSLMVYADLTFKVVAEVFLHVAITTMANVLI